MHGDFSTRLAVAMILFHEPSWLSTATALTHHNEIPMPQENVSNTLPVLPRIDRFQNLGYGMFLHWGLYSQLGCGEWVQHNRPVERKVYAALAKTFTAENFDADAWCRLAADAGMKYLCLTTRHHDGFSLYDTRGLNTFDAPSSPAKRDLVAEYIDACNRNDLLPMLYHTTMDWFWRDKKTYDLDQAEMNEYLQYLNDSVEILCTQYGPIGGLWFDGNWCRPDLDWHVADLYALIRRHQPEAIIVNNTGLDEQGKLGHPEVDSVTFEQGEPSFRDQSAQAKFVAGEMCQTMNNHWGIGTQDFNYKSPAHIIEMLCKCRKVGANYLLNVGPTAQGGIPDYEQAALRRAGDWVRQASDAVYHGQPLPQVQCAGDDFMLRVDGDADYYFAFRLGREGDAHVTLEGGGIGPRAIGNYDRAIGEIAWLDNGEKLDFSQNAQAGLMSFNATGYPYGTDLIVRIARLVPE